MDRRPQAVRPAQCSRGFAPTALALAIALVGCQTAPPLPPLSPLEQAKQFGYTDRDIAPDRFEVTYLGPRRRVISAVPTPRDAETQPARTEAMDFATWRAAQIALARGIKGLRIVDRQTHVDSHPEGPYPLGGNSWPYWRYPGGFIYGPPGFYSVPAVYFQARATVTVQLLAEPQQPDDLDAAATIARLRAAHPDAEGPSAPPSRPTSQLPR